MFPNPVRLTSKAPLCFHSVITTSQQAVNSAPLAAVSPTMAIKSTLIPHPSLLQRGEGQSVSWYTNRGLCGQTHTTLLQSHAPGVMRWSALTANRTVKAGSVRPSDLTSFWHMMWDHMQIQGLVQVNELVHYLLACYSTIFPPQLLLPLRQWVSFLFSTRHQFPQLYGHSKCKIPPPSARAAWQATLERGFSEHVFCFLQQRKHNEENHRKPMNSLREHG